MLVSQRTMISTARKLGEFPWLWTVVIVLLMLGVSLAAEPAAAQCTVNPEAQYWCYAMNVPVNSPPVLCHTPDLTPSLSCPSCTAISQYTINSVSGGPAWASLVSIQQPSLTAGGAAILSLDVTGMSPGCYTTSVNYTYTTITIPLYLPSCLASGGVMVGDTCYVVTQTTTTTLINVYVYSDTRVLLVDPVPDLLAGSTVKNATQLQGLLTSARRVSGVASDGVTQVVIRIQTTSAGHQFAVKLLNGQGTQSSLSNEDGALGNPGDTSFTLSLVTVTAGPADSNGLAYAFAVYRAPWDFARQSTNTDDQLAYRSVSLQVQDLTTGGTPITVPITILRPPVILIHGLWDDWTTWNGFAPLVTGPNSVDARFSIGRVSYNAAIGPLITASDPAYPQRRLARANSLGFQYNASGVLKQIRKWIGSFKGGSNPGRIPVAAVQVDIVAHSMGGDVARTLPLQPTFLTDTFGRGIIHKVITIDTPHLGSPLAIQFLSPQENGGCLQGLLAGQGKFAFNTVTLSGAGVVSGAIADLMGNGVGVDTSLSPALQNIANQNSLRLPTALIAGVYTNFASLDTSLRAFLIRHWPTGCSGDPLAQSLTAAGWPQIFNNQPNDAIVPETSQLNNLIPSPGSQFFGYVHSQGTTKLGFSGPSVLDGVAVPNQVIKLLNTPWTQSVYYNLLP